MDNSVRKYSQIAYCVIVLATSYLLEQVEVVLGCVVFILGKSLGAVEVSPYYSWPTV